MGHRIEVLYTRPYLLSIYCTIQISILCSNIVRSNKHAIKTPSFRHTQTTTSSPHFYHITCISSEPFLTALNRKTVLQPVPFALISNYILTMSDLSADEEELTVELMMKSRVHHIDTESAVTSDTRTSQVGYS